jgi:hypothetical protein
VLRRVQDVCWFAEEHADWVRAYTEPAEEFERVPLAEEDYFDYTRQDCAFAETSHLLHMLAISDSEDSAVILLNPMVVWGDGEWEAWFFANWLPGAERYRSFAELMRYELARVSDEVFEHPVPGALPTVYLDGPSTSLRRVRPRDPVLTVDEAITQLSSTVQGQRVAAVRQLRRIGDAGAIAVLIDLLRCDGDWRVRSEAAESLGRLRAEAAVDALMAVAREASQVSGHAVRALGLFADEPSAQCLLELVRHSRISGATVAIALAARKDSRGAAALVAKLVSRRPDDYSLGNIAGRLVAEFGGAGLEALIPLTVHEDEQVRHRAFGGVVDIASRSKNEPGAREARAFLEQYLAGSPDPKLQDWLGDVAQDWRPTSR